MSGALDGIEVVELGSAVAGPFGGKLLSDNGAHVIRVEPTDGSLMRKRRAWYDAHDNDEFTYRFLPYNTGKESIAVDMKAEEGKQIIKELLNEADICIENMRTGTMDRLDLGWDDLHPEFPELIYCSVSGYGEHGPYADWPAYDPVIQGVSGWAHHTGEQERPELTDIIAIDHATAMYATVGVLMALIERSVSGEGQRIDVSMFDAAISFLGHQFGELSAAYALDDVESTFKKSVEPIGIYETADGYLSLLAPPEYWESFCKVTGHDEWADEGHKFGSLDARIEHSRELHDILRNEISTRSVQEWIEIFNEQAPGVVCAPVNHVPDLPNDPHVRARETVSKRDHPEMGEYLVPGPVMRFSRSEFHLGPAPGIGEHTGDILKALGHTEKNIEELRERGVIR